MLVGLLSFWHQGTSTVGSMRCTDSARRKFAKNSMKFNMKNYYFVDLFGESEVVKPV